jgi:hypothetical protein
MIEALAAWMTQRMPQEQAELHRPLRDDGMKKERDEEVLPCMRKRRDLQLKTKRSLLRNSIE